MKLAGTSFEPEDATQEQDVVQFSATYSGQVVLGDGAEQYVWRRWGGGGDGGGGGGKKVVSETLSLSLTSGSQSR